MNGKILAVDDDEVLLKLIKRTLKSEGYEVFTATCGQDALITFPQVAPDLVILDIMMPDMDGWQVCHRLRQMSCVPIIFLSALSTVEDVVQGLMTGADDYLTKPFEIAELRARVAALMRRARMTPTPPHILRFGNGELVINRNEQQVFVQDQKISLTPIEYNMLLFLAQRAGQILPPEQIYDAIWGAMAEANPQSVKWYIWSLRQKIEPTPKTPRFILTERGRGYRFSPL